VLQRSVELAAPIGELERPPKRGLSMQIGSPIHSMVMGMGFPREPPCRLMTPTERESASRSMCKCPLNSFLL
jgi:hypothetical protein